MIQLAALAIITITETKTQGIMILIELIITKTHDVTKTEL